MKSNKDVKAKDEPKTAPPKEEPKPVTAVAVKPPAQLATRDGVVAPEADPFASDETAGVTLPRVNVSQPSSGVASLEEGAIGPGEFYDALTKKSMGKSFEFIAFKHFLTRVRLVPQQGLKCRSTDMRTAQLMGGKQADGSPTNDCSLCVYRQWPADRPDQASLTEKQLSSGPECSSVDNFLAMNVLKDVEPSKYPFIVLQFMRTSAKAAKDLKGIWMASQAPLETFVYRDRSLRQTNGDLVWFKQDLSQVRGATEAEIAAAEKLRGVILGTSVIEAAARETQDDTPEMAGTKASASKDY